MPADAAGMRPPTMRLTAHLRPLVEAGRGRLRTASAYLQADKDTVDGSS